MTPDQLVNDACPRIGALGAAFYFIKPTVAAGKERGLDGFRFYFLGRGGVLGDVEAPVIQSAFGYFEPNLLAKMWTSAKEVLPPREAAKLYLGCAHDFGRANFADVDRLDAFCAAAEKVIAAVDPAGLPLYAGVAGEPRPDDLPARAMHDIVVLREYRGSVHLLAVVASGLEPSIAHLIRRPDDWTTFGYPEDKPEVTDDHRAKLAAADELTDRLVSGPYGVLDPSEADVMASVLAAMEAKMAG